MTLENSTIINSREIKDCLFEGTRILTYNGYRPIENLKKGDKVMVLQNGYFIPKPIKWIGKHVHNIDSNNKLSSSPVRIKKSAIAENVPNRDLLITPGHSIFINDLLIESLKLANGKTIYQDYSFNIVKYYHIKLDKHYIMNAEGVLLESYFDAFDENRKTFDNLNEIDPDDLAIDKIKKGTEIEIIRSESAAYLVLDEIDKIEPVQKMLAKRANL